MSHRLQVRERELEDNLQLRRRQTEIDEASRKVALLVERLGGLDVTNLNEERKHLISEQDELRRQVKTAEVFLCRSSWLSSRYIGRARPVRSIKVLLNCLTRFELI